MNTLWNYLKNTRSFYPAKFLNVKSLGSSFLFFLVVHTSELLYSSSRLFRSVLKNKVVNLLLKLFSRKYELISIVVLTIILAHALNFLKTWSSFECVLFKNIQLERQNFINALWMKTYFKKLIGSFSAENLLVDVDFLRRWENWRNLFCYLFCLMVLLSNFIKCWSFLHFVSPNFLNKIISELLGQFYLNLVR